MAKQRKAAFATPPTGPNQVWQFDFSEYETTGGGTWRVAGVADYYSKYEFGWHWSPTANQHDAIAGVELALAEAEAMLDGTKLIDHLTDPVTGEIVPITLVTDNGGPFRSFRFEHFITAHPELRHVRTRVRTPGQNGVRERAFQSLKYERLYREQIDDALDLVREADAFRAEFNTIRPTRHSPGIGPHRSTAVWPTPASPTFPSPKSCQLLDAGHRTTLVRSVNNRGLPRMSERPDRPPLSGNPRIVARPGPGLSGLHPRSGSPIPSSEMGDVGWPGVICGDG